MKISDVRVETVEVTLPDSLGLSRDREIGSRGAAFVIIETDEGIRGIGEGYGPESYIIETIVEEKFKPMLMDENPLDTERIWRKMLMDDLYWDQKGQKVSAASGVDMALWDIAGKHMDQPVYKLLGGDVTGEGRIKSYASDLFWDSPKIMAEKAREYEKDGFQAVKTHLGRGLEKDEERVEAIKNSLDEADLMVDMNCGYNRVKALKVGKMLENHDIYWYEEPLSPYDIDGYAQLKNKLDIPIATGENEYTKWGFRKLFEKNGVDFVMPDIMRCGGITESKKISAIAETYGITVTPHNYTTGIGLAATLHLLASTPNSQWLELDVTEYPLYESLLETPLDIDNEGRVKIPQDPGLGVKLENEIIEKYGREH